jgi:hypothetical protein
VGLADCAGEDQQQVWRDIAAALEQAVRQLESQVPSNPNQVQERPDVAQHEQRYQERRLRQRRLVGNPDEREPVLLQPTLRAGTVPGYQGAQQILQPTQPLALSPLEQQRQQQQPTAVGLDSKVPDDALSCSPMWQLAMAC